MVCSNLVTAGRIARERGIEPQAVGYRARQRPVISHG